MYVQIKIARNENQKHIDSGRTRKTAVASSLLVERNKIHNNPRTFLVASFFESSARISLCLCVEKNIYLFKTDIPTHRPRKKPKRKKDQRR